jgi:hypothetical protein
VRWTPAGTLSRYVPFEADYEAPAASFRSGSPTRATCSPYRWHRVPDDHQIGYKALPRGVPVHTSDGAQLGTVHRVLDNEREHIFDGIVVATKDGRRFVDAPEVARITPNRVTLTLDAAAARNLPVPRGASQAPRWWRRLTR